MEDVLVILSIISPVVTAGLALYVFLESKAHKRRERKNHQNQKQKNQHFQEALEYLMPSIKECVNDKLGNYVPREEDEMVNERFATNIKDLTNKWEFLNKLFVKSELSRLRSEIINFAEDIDNGQKKSTASFAHIHEVYQSYVDLNGNGFIDGLFDRVIREAEKNARD